MQRAALKNNKIRSVAMNGLIMALYLGLTILVAPVSSGPIQFRVSESLNHLVVFNRKLMWGVLGGVIIYNLFFGFGVMDAFYGGIQSFLSLGLTALLQKKISNVKIRLALNTLFFTISMILIAVMLVPTGGQQLWITYGTLALSEFIIMSISAPLMYWINLRVHFDQRI